MQPNTADNSDLEQILQKYLQQNHLPVFDNYLLEKIMDRINYERQLKTLRPKFWQALAMLVSGLAVLIISIKLSWHPLALSPSLKYLSLMFSDFKAVLDNWQDYAYGLLESLPLGTLAFLLGGFLASLFLIDASYNGLLNYKKLLNHHHELNWHWKSNSKK